VARAGGDAGDGVREQRKVDAGEAYLMILNAETNVDGSERFDAMVLLAVALMERLPEHVGGETIYAIATALMLRAMRQGVS
jgi:hypothetical protein